MNFNIASDLMYHLAGDDPGIEPASKDMTDWFEALSLPTDLKRMLQLKWPKHKIYLDSVCLYSPMGIRHAEWTSAMLPYKLLIVGDCPNGDWLVIDFSSDDCNVGFVTHEEYQYEGDPRPYYQPAFRCLEAYLHRISEGRFTPCDYYEAKSFVAFLTDERECDAVPPFKRRRDDVGQPKID